MEMWLHQPGAAAGGPSMATGHLLCYLSMVDSTGRCMAQQHTGGPQQADTPIEKQPLGFFSIHPPAAVDPWKPGVWHSLRSGHLSAAVCCFSLNPQGLGLKLHVIAFAGNHPETRPCLAEQDQPAGSALPVSSLRRVYNSNLMHWTYFFTAWELHRKSRNFFFIWLLNGNEAEEGPVSQQWANDAIRTIRKGQVSASTRGGAGSALACPACLQRTSFNFSFCWIFSNAKIIACI